MGESKSTSDSSVRRTEFVALNFEECKPRRNLID